MKTILSLGLMVLGIAFFSSIFPIIEIATQVERSPLSMFLSTFGVLSCFGATVTCFSIAITRMTE